MTPKPTFSRFILNNHQKKNNDKQRLEAISKTEPEKSVACQRCRRLRKKCSKHYPNCLTCVKMREECEYVDKLPSKRRTANSIEELTSNTTNSTNDTAIITQTHHTNYSYQDSLHSDLRSSSIDLNISSQIKLPSISLKSQPQNVINNQTNNNKFNNDKSNEKITGRPKVDIQNAIISTLINLGKQNFNSFRESPTSLMITKEATLKYSKSYFDNFNHLFPFIHKGQFYKEVSSINLYNLINPSSSTQLDHLKKNFQIFLILNIGFKNLHNSNNLNAEEIEQHHQIFTNTKIQEYIFSSLTFNSTEDLKILTLLVIDSFFSKNCWSTTNLTNLLTGIAMRLNLHRKLGTTRAGEFSMFAIEMRYRLFWSIYVLDRTVSLYFNKLISFPDDYINLPYPIYCSEFDSGSTGDHFNESNFKLIVELKQIEGSIFKEVHSVLALNHKSVKENEAILRRFRNRIESWYLKATARSSKQSSINDNCANEISSIWYTTRYYNCLTLLYRHSYLNPVLNNDLLDKLSKAVLQNLSYSYNLTINKTLFSINWMSFFRILLILKTLLNCLVSGSINFYESKTELNLCIELLKNFVNQNEDWLFVYEIIDIFQNILKVSFIENLETDEILQILKKAEDYLTNVLKNNSVGCRLGDKIEDEYNLDERIDEEYNYRKKSL